MTLVISVLKIDFEVYFSKSKDLKFKAPLERELNTFQLPLPPGISGCSQNLLVILKKNKSEMTPFLEKRFHCS